MLNALIIEDETALQFLYKRVLKQENFKIDVAGDGVIAMDYLAETMPDLILMDMRMPHASGLDVILYLQEHPDVEKTHVVIISASQEFQRYVNMLPSAEFMLKAVQMQKLAEIAERIQQNSMD